jgi:hypothetical protein
VSLLYPDSIKAGHDVFAYRGVFWWNAVTGLWTAASLANPLPVVPIGWGTAANGANVTVVVAAGNEAELLPANIARFKFRMLNEGPGIARILHRTPLQAAANADATSFPVFELSEHVEENSSRFPWRVYADGDDIVVRLLTYIE